jgi:transposase, IS5 family
VIRDIRRKITGRPDLESRFAELLALALRVRFQDHRQRGPKVYALHAPEVECIGKGKARAPYEFGGKLSVAAPATKPKSCPRESGGRPVCAARQGLARQPV